MAATYEPLATTTLGSNQTSVTFNSFSGYTDLVLVANVKATNGTTGRWFKVVLNSDTGSNYSITYIQGNGSSATSGRYSNRSDGCFMGLTNSTNYIPIIINFENYANATTYKTMISRSSAVSSDGVMSCVGLWRSTSAITSISVNIESVANDLWPRTKPASPSVSMKAL